MLVSVGPYALHCSLQHGSLGRGIRNIHPEELFIDLLFDVMHFIQVVDIIQVDVFGIRAVRLMFLIDPFSAIPLICLMGFLLDLACQSGGRTPPETHV